VNDRGKRSGNEADDENRKADHGERAQLPPTGEEVGEKAAERLKAQGCATTDGGGASSARRTSRPTFLIRSKKAETNAKPAASWVIRDKATKDVVMEKAARRGTNTSSPSINTAARSFTSPEAIGRLWFEGKNRPGRLRQASHQSDPTKIGGAICQRCVREGQVRRRPTCWANHPHTAGSRGTAQIATASLQRIPFCWPTPLRLLILRRSSVRCPDLPHAGLAPLRKPSQAVPFA
jgi:hypothetical protein